MKGTRGIILIAWVLLGVFVCVGSASAAGETGRTAGLSPTTTGPFWIPAPA